MSSRLLSRLPRTWLIFPMLGALSALLLAPGIAIGPSLDAAVFTTVAEQLGRGAVLYREAWDHKPPGIYAVLLLGTTILPWVAPWVVSWLVSVLATFVAGAMIVWIARESKASWTAAAGAAILGTLAMGQYLVALGGGLTEPLATAFAAGALALHGRGAGGNTRHLVPGALLGLATLTSLLLAPAVVALVVLIGLQADTGRWRGLALFAAGLAAPWLIAVAVLGGLGALPAALDAVVNYPAAYRGAAAELGASLSAAPLAWTALSMLGLVAGAALGFMALVRRGGGAGALAIAMGTWLVVAALLVALQGRFIAHYAIPLALPLAILTAHGLDRRATRSRAPAAAPLAIVLVAAVVSVVAGTAGGAYDLDANRTRAVQIDATARYLTAHSAGGDAILVWGNRAELYVAAQRPPATSYAFMYPLTTDGYSTPTTIADLAAALAADPPAFVVDAGSPAPGEPGFLPLLISRPVAAEGRELDLLQPLRSFIQAHYELAATPAGWPIYRLTASPASRL